MKAATWSFKYLPARGIWYVFLDIYTEVHHLAFHRAPSACLLSPATIVHVSGQQASSHIPHNWCMHLPFTLPPLHTAFQTPHLFLFLDLSGNASIFLAIHPHNYLSILYIPLLAAFLVHIHKIGLDRTCECPSPDFDSLIAPMPLALLCRGDSLGSTNDNLFHITVIPTARALLASRRLMHRWLVENKSAF